MTFLLIKSTYGLSIKQKIFQIVIIIFTEAEVRDTFIIMI